MFRQDQVFAPMIPAAENYLRVAALLAPASACKALFLVKGAILHCTRLCLVLACTSTSKIAIFRGRGILGGVCTAKPDVGLTQTCVTKGPRSSRGAGMPLASKHHKSYHLPRFDTTTGCHNHCKMSHFPQYHHSRSRQDFHYMSPFSTLSGSWPV